MFTRRDRGSATQEAPAPVAQGKGKPTPKRRESEQERRDRIKPPRNSRARAQVERKKRSEARTQMREALDKGDQRYLPKRDQGPVRKLVRDVVDGRMTAAEFFMPIALASLVFMLVGAGAVGSSLSMTMILVVFFDSAIFSTQVRKTLKRKFPDESTKGALQYALMRALTWRSLRTPKPQVPRGYKP